MKVYIDSRDYDGREPLSQAVGSYYGTLVRLLLKARKARAISRDGTEYVFNNVGKWYPGNHANCLRLQVTAKWVRL